jgi:hypothetical protein
VCCEGLICASCAGPVIEGRCSVCRAARDHVHHAQGVSPQLLAVVLAAVTVILLLMAHHL